MDEDREHSQLSPDKVDNAEDEDSFYARDDVDDRENDKQSSEPQQSKHKQLKSKKKGISKKKERMSKPSKKPRNTLITQS